MNKGTFFKTMAALILLVLSLVIFRAAQVARTERTTDKCPYCLKGMCKTYYEPTETEYVMGKDGRIEYHSIVYFTEDLRHSYTVHMTDEQIISDGIPQTITDHYKPKTATKK
jgi:hypothetical protein